MSNCYNSCCEVDTNILILHTELNLHSLSILISKAEVSILMSLLGNPGLAFKMVYFEITTWRTKMEA